MTIASVERVLTYDGWDFPTHAVHMEERVDSTKLGGQLETAVGVQLGRSIQLGGVVRYALVPNVDDVAYGPNARLGVLAIGPQATVFATPRVYLRGDVALGQVSHNRVDATGVTTGIELGYGRLVDGRFVQVGLAVSTTRANYEEAGDHGTYHDRFRLLAISAVLSMNLGRHP